MEYTESAQNRIGQMLGMGLALAVVAAIVLTLGWPHEELCTFAEECDDGVKQTGSYVAVGVGLLVATVANILIGIFVIATGVRLGVRAADEGPLEPKIKDES